MAGISDVPEELEAQPVEVLSREIVDSLNSGKSFSSEDRKAAIGRWMDMKFEAIRAWNKANPEISFEEARAMWDYISRPPMVVAVEMRDQIIAKLDSLDRTADERVDLTAELDELNRFCDEWCTAVPRLGASTLRRIARAQPSYERSALEKEFGIMQRARNESR